MRRDGKRMDNSSSFRFVTTEAAHSRSLQVVPSQRCLPHEEHARE